MSQRSEPIHRRTLLRTGAVVAGGVAAGALAACSRPTDPPKPPARLVSPPSTASASPPARPAPAYGAALTATLTRYLAPTPENPKHPTYAGAVALVLVNGEPTAQIAVGDALRYRAGPIELPPGQRVAMRADSVFDLASITKVYTAILTLQQVDAGRLDVNAPVVDYLPEFGHGGAGKAAVTVAQLLAHTSGLPVGANLAGLSDNQGRWAAVLATPLVAGAVPGRLFRYSSVGFMVLGRLVEKLTGHDLDAALRQGITNPLGLRDTGFLPLRWLSQADQSARLVATDARSSRGLLRGVVHDDVANTLGGVAGHAGIFSTAAEVAIIAETLRAGGAYGGVRILSEAVIARMLTDVNRGLPATDPDRPHRTADHGLGVELDQPWFMGRLASATSFGHTGFTGTSFLVDPAADLSLILLTNRAHPNWSWANPDPMRAAVANVIADALGR
jgi:CubicO group peptidase (beta-lactamase class C family)